MAMVAGTPSRLHGHGSCASLSSTWHAPTENRLRIRFLSSTIRVSISENDKDKAYNQLGSSSLKKKIEYAVLRAETSAPAVLEVEEARQIKQEEMIRDRNLWDDPVESNEILVDLADTTKLVKCLKDLKYKAEEAKLITLLTEKESIENPLFKEAYDASVDICKFLDQYEMCKLFKGPYDMEGACLMIKAGGSNSSEIWAEQILSMYKRWANKQGYKGRVVEKCLSKNGGITSATLEFEHDYSYGYLLGERGAHLMISNQGESAVHLAGLAEVDVIPMFLQEADIQLDDEDLMISSSGHSGEELGGYGAGVCVQHIPTGIRVQSSGERSCFANKIKALNRLKAKLLVIAKKQGVSEVNSIQGDDIEHSQRQPIRRYICQPYKLVEDVKTGIQLPDLDSVLDGNIEPLIAAHVDLRQELT